MLVDESAWKWKGYFPSMSAAPAFDSFIDDADSFLTLPWPHNQPVNRTSVNELSLLAPIWVDFGLGPACAQNGRNQ